MPQPTNNETYDHYINRCMIDNEMNSKHTNEKERYAVCQSFWKNSSTDKISFDYDGTLSTNKGKDIASATAGEIYIISARGNKDRILLTADKLGIPHDHVFAVGSNIEKINKIKELGIKRHYDNNPTVVNTLGKIGKLI